MTEHLQLFQRHTLNPILTAKKWPYPINSVFNPGVTLLKDGTTLLLCRVEDRRGLSHLCVARSKNGIDDWQIDAEPTLLPEPSRFPEEEWGVEDPRVTFIPELDQYVITYTAYSRIGPGVAIAMTKDFRTFEKFGLVLPPENKDAAVLPERINGKWAIIHRPVINTQAHMWISYSPDLKDWGTPKIIMKARIGGWWDANKIGLSGPPIKTPEGWLTIYHGVKWNASGAIYRLGLALFDLKSPDVCIRRGDEWIFAPEESYEIFGDVDKVVFPCGHTILPDGDTIHLYYGAADTSIALATGSVKSLLQWLNDHHS